MDQLTLEELNELSALCPQGMHRDVDLSGISQWRIGGKADLMLCPSSTDEVAALMRWFAGRGIRPVVIGLTTNLLFADEGLRVPCIQIGPRMAQTRIEGDNVYAAAGIWVPGLARRLMQKGLGGGEHICGIPGTLGGLICMNGGSQRKGIGSAVVNVESVDPSGAIRQRYSRECGFSYRNSVFQTNGEIITAAHMRFTLRRRTEIRTEMLAILADRRRKFPRKEPNCGSVFKSNPTMYAEIGPPGAVIERLGFKGQRAGGAAVSPEHANFIINVNGAKAADILELINRVGNSVRSATGYTLESEVLFVTERGEIRPAYTPEGR